MTSLGEMESLLLTAKHSESSMQWGNCSTSLDIQMIRRKKSWSLGNNISHRNLMMQWIWKIHDRRSKFKVSTAIHLLTYNNLKLQILHAVPATVHYQPPYIYQLLGKRKLKITQQHKPRKSHDTMSLKMWRQYTNIILKLQNLHAATGHYQPA